MLYRLGLQREMLISMELLSEMAAGTLRGLNMGYTRQSRSTGWTLSSLFICFIVYHGNCRDIIFPTRVHDEVYVLGQAQ